MLRHTEKMRVKGKMSQKIKPSPRWVAECDWFLSNNPSHTPSNPTLSHRGTAQCAKARASLDIGVDSKGMETGLLS